MTEAQLNGFDVEKNGAQKANEKTTKSRTECREFN